MFLVLFCFLLPYHEPFVCTYVAFIFSDFLVCAPFFLSKCHQTTKSASTVATKVIRHHRRQVVC